MTIKKRILITGGGTAVAIDPVRSITNHSTGRFAASLAKAALLAGCEVFYLVSHNGLSPFSTVLNCVSHSGAENLKILQDLTLFFEEYGAFYHEIRYQSFEEYKHLLKNIISSEKLDMVMLAAAVSDYLVSDYSGQKIRSTANLNIQLKPAPKLIEAIKKWCPSLFLVGFKLLIDACDEELIAVAREGFVKHQADLIIANNLISIQQGKHEVILIDSQGGTQKYAAHQAELIFAQCLRKLCA